MRAIDLSQELNMAQARFEFPGFTFTGSQDSGTHEVDIGRIEIGGAVFALTMIRNAQFQNLSFMLASVANVEGKVLWSFKDEVFNGVGLLAKAGDETVIALVGKGRDGKVERVIPLTFLHDGKKRDIVSGIVLKRATAGFLLREYELSANEMVVIKVQAKRVIDAQTEAERLRREARDNARIEFVKRL